MTDRQRAHFVYVAICDDTECERPHLVLADAEGNEFAEAVIDEKVQQALANWTTKELWVARAMLAAACWGLR